MERDMKRTHKEDHPKTMRVAFVFVINAINICLSSIAHMLFH